MLISKSAIMPIIISAFLWDSLVIEFFEHVEISYDVSFLANELKIVHLRCGKKSEVFEIKFCKKRQFETDREDKRQH